MSETHQIPCNPSQEATELEAIAVALSTLITRNHPAKLAALTIAPTFDESTPQAALTHHPRTTQKPRHDLQLRLNPAHWTALHPDQKAALLARLVAAIQLTPPPYRNHAGRVQIESGITEADVNQMNPTRYTKRTTKA